MASVAESRQRKHFIVKHGLDAFQALPGFIWRTGRSRNDMPRNFAQVKLGDRWVEFAYIRDEQDEETCSLITGFYECTRKAWYATFPQDRSAVPDSVDWYWDDKGWMIEGKQCGPQPSYGPVSVPSINQMLGRTVFGRGAIIPGLSAKEFELIRKETLSRELDPSKIPILGREPTCEQEVLTVVVGGHKELGIDKILKVQTRFPDMLVSINGQDVYLELELDSLDFQSHGHVADLRRTSHGKLKGRREAKLKHEDDPRPVAVLCWVDSNRSHELQEDVPDLRVFELQTLLRTGRKIGW